MESRTYLPPAYNSFNQLGALLQYEVYQIAQLTGVVSAHESLSPLLYGMCAAYSKRIGGRVGKLGAGSRMELELC
jgi:hypothetical protein